MFTITFSQTYIVVERAGGMLGLYGTVKSHENIFPWHITVTMYDGDLFKSFSQSPIQWDIFRGFLI